MVKHNITIITTILSLSILFNVASPANTHADDITNIAGFTELNECYTSGVMKSDIGTITSGLTTSQLYTGDGDGKAHVPNMWNNTIADGDLSCDELIRGYNRSDIGGNGGGKWTALVSKLSATDATGGSASVTRDKAIPWLKKMGYKAKSNGGSSNSKACINIDYMKKTSGTSYSDARKKTGTLAHTHELCANGLSNGKTTNSTTFSVNKNGVEKITQISYDSGAHKVSFHDGGWGILRTTYGDIDVSAGASWKNDIVQGFYDIMKSKRSSIEESKGSNHEGDKEYIVYDLKIYDPTAGLDDGENEGDYDEVNGNWVFDGSASNAAKIAISQNSSYSSAADLKFTEEQKKQLHQHYFSNYFKAKLICEGDADYDTLTATDDTVKATNVTTKSCFAKAGDLNPKHNKYTPAKVNAIKPDLTWHTQYTFAELVANMSEEELLNAAEATEGENGNTEGEERDPDCHTKAGALGWILCPIIDISSNMVEQVYTNMIQPYLSIDAALFDTSQKGGQTVREVWSLFQGFANLTFVILFLVVIFSQLTGVGIDNYGIKKILPKLIIGAVLINMSYLICQLAVDLSNILGRAIASMFEGVASGINSDLAAKTVNLYPGQASSVSGKFSGVGDDHGAGTILLVIVGIAGIFGIGAFLAAGPAIIIPVLLALISLVVGIFFLFALLALRQAIAVILVVVSPMAFAMYMLPNTKKIFDKWYQAFKGMLVAYPIASALVFGGDLVSKILLVADGSAEITSLGLLLSAAVVGVAPIFFIPSVIRKSMNAISGLGNIANNLQHTAAGKLRTPAQSYLNRSGLNDYKLRRQEAKEAGASDRRMRKKGQIARNRLAKLDGKDPDKMSRRQRVQYRQAVRDEAAYAKSEADLSSSYITSLGNADLSARMVAGLEEGDMEKFGSAMDELGGRDQGELLAQLTTLSETDAWKNMDERKKAAVAAKLRGQKGNPFAQAYGKLIAQEKAGNVSSFNTLAGKGKIQDKVKENGTANLASMDKDVYKWLNGDPSYKNAAGTNTQALARDSFRSDDLAEAMGQVSGAQQAQFAQFIATRGQQATDAKAVSDAQLANGGNAAIAAAYAGASSDQIKTAVNTGQVNDDTIKTNIQRTFHDQIENINANNELAGATNKGLADAAGIKAGPQQVVIAGIKPGFSGGGAGGGTGGGPAPAPGGGGTGGGPAPAPGGGGTGGGPAPAPPRPRPRPSPGGGSGSGGRTA